MFCCFWHVFEHACFKSEYVYGLWIVYFLLHAIWHCQLSVGMWFGISDGAHILWTFEGICTMNIYDSLDWLSLSHAHTISLRPGLRLSLQKLLYLSIPPLVFPISTMKSKGATSKISTSIRKFPFLPSFKYALFHKPIEELAAFNIFHHDVKLTMLRWWTNLIIEISYLIFSIISPLRVFSMSWEFFLCMWF